MEAVAKPSSTRSQQVHQQQIAIEIISEPAAAPQPLQHQELQAHTLLQQCQQQSQQQQQSALPTPNVDIVLRESTRANLVSRKKPSVGPDGRKSSHKDGKGDGKGEGKSVYRKFFKRIKTILDGEDPDAGS
ncbi:uncharacterized protein LOC128276127, partial [Anopheles cruzii]|uniref:uncharacterized protein LOC128276127 n=1 Tax=Anopheles cruzii TaxID=68878 RepID=UPI0022EC4D1A